VGFRAQSACAGEAGEVVAAGLTNLVATGLAEAARAVVVALSRLPGALAAGLSGLLGAVAAG
jgi:hypothetical protein